MYSNRLYFVYCLDAAHISRLANIAYGYSCPISANEALRLLFADDLKRQRKKAEEEAKMTPEAIAKRDADKEAKRIATNARAKAKRDAERLAKQNGNVLTGELVADQTEQLDASGSDGSGNESESSDESDTSSQQPDEPDEEEEDDDDDDIEEIMASHFKTNSKQKTSKAGQGRQVKLAKDKIRKAMVSKLAKLNKVTAVATQIAPVNQTTSATSSNLLETLQEAYRRMLTNTCRKENIKNADSLVGALVCLQVSLLYIIDSFRH